MSAWLSLIRPVLRGRQRFQQQWLEFIPTADIVDVTPDPRTTAAGRGDSEFQRVSDGGRHFRLPSNTQQHGSQLGWFDGLAVSASQYTVNLTSVTGLSGSYALSWWPRDRGSRSSWQ